MGTPVLIFAIIGGISLAAWLHLAFNRSSFWKTDVRLGSAGPGGSEYPGVAVILPARDEADVLPVTLPTLLAQRYPGECRVFLVDDSSSDGTSGTAARVAGETGNASRLSIVPAPQIAPGWAGKPWAMQQGLNAIGESGFAPTYVLLTDADISHPSDGLLRLVTHAESGNYDTVSVMARLRTATSPEKLLIPAFVYFFSLLYPFRRVADRATSTAAAAGGCLLIRTGRLMEIGGFESIASRRIDDCSLARAVRDSGGSCWLGYSEGFNSTRAYQGVYEIWKMVSRSAYEQLEFSPLNLAGTVTGLGVMFAAPVVSAAAGFALLVAGGVGAAAWVAAGTGIAAWLLMAGTLVPVLRWHGLSPVRSILLPVSAALFLAMTVDSALRHHFGSGVEWKGRTVPGPGPPATRN